VYEPHSDVGGDFYDAVSLKDGNLAIFLADVVGHGIQAALVTGLLKSTCTSLSGQGLEAGQILKELNRILHQTLPVNIYAAGMILIIDDKTGQCKIVNAGIPHPFVIREADGKIERIAVNGLVLGVAAEKIFNPGDQRMLKLNAGDKLVLFSDGLIEVEGEDKSHFEDHLIDNIEDLKEEPLDCLLTKIHERAEEFSRTGHHWDDVTMLGIELQK